MLLEKILLGSQTRMTKKAFSERNNQSGDFFRTTFRGLGLNAWIPAQGIKPAFRLFNSGPIDNEAVC
jgi:hypothetical protein